MGIKGARGASLGGSGSPKTSKHSGSFSVGERRMSHMRRPNPSVDEADLVGMTVGKSKSKIFGSEETGTAVKISRH